MERYDVGLVLAFVGGIMTTLVQGIQLVYSVINSLSLFYGLGMAVGLCVIAGSIISYRSIKLSGGLLVFFASSLFVADFLILLATGPSFHISGYEPFALGSPWLLFSLIGGTLMLSRRKTRSTQS
jgi:hypothetical protein